MTPAGSTRASLPVDGPMLGEVDRASVARRPGRAHHAGPRRSALPRRPPHRRHPGAARRDGHGGVRRGRPAARCPAGTSAAVEDVDFRAPVKFYRDEPRTLTITRAAAPDGDDLVADCRLSAERMLPGAEKPQQTVHFTGSVRLTRATRRASTTTAGAAPGDGTPASTPDAGLPAVLPRPGLPGGRARHGATATARPPGSPDDLRGRRWTARC